MKNIIFFTRLLLVGVIMLEAGCSKGNKEEKESIAVATSMKTSDSNESTSDEVKVTTEVATSTIATPEKQDPRNIPLPVAKVEYPEFPVDKSGLEKVGQMEQMIQASADVKLVFDQFSEMFNKLEDGADVSMSGTNEDLMKAVMQIVNTFQEFEATAVDFGKRGLERFRKQYSTDSEFGEQYREVYYAAEEEASAEIEDKVVGRKVWTILSNHYKLTPSPGSEWLEDKINEIEEIKQNAIDQVLSSVRTDLMVVDYKNDPKDISDVLRGGKNRLTLLATLDPQNEEINSVMAELVEKEASRKEQIAKARESYLFPTRYEGGNLPSNYNDLEEKMEDFLSEFKYTSTDNYNVQKIAVAGPWIKIYHVLTGAHLYSQIDFYVAVPAADESGIIDVLLVTGKTDGPNQSSFGTYSVGGIGQMVKSNL